MIELNDLVVTELEPLNTNVVVFLRPSFVKTDKIDHRQAVFPSIFSLSLYSLICETNSV